MPNNPVQLQTTPTVDSNMHHVGVDSFANSYTEGTERVSHYLGQVSFARLAYYAMFPSSLYSLLFTWMFVVTIGTMNVAGNVLFWLVDRGRRRLGSNKLAESGWIKLHSTIKATPAVVTQNLARPLGSYSPSAAQETWDLGNPKVYASSSKSFCEPLDPIRIEISHLSKIPFNTYALFGSTRSWRFSTKASYSFVISIKELFVRTVLWPGGSHVQSASDNVHIIIRSQSAECPIQQPLCLLVRICTPSGLTVSWTLCGTSV